MVIELYVIGRDVMPEDLKLVIYKNLNKIKLVYARKIPGITLEMVIERVIIPIIITLISSVVTEMTELIEVEVTLIMRQE